MLYGRLALAVLERDPAITSKMGTVPNCGPWTSMSSPNPGPATLRFGDTPCRRPSSLNRSLPERDTAALPSVTGLHHGHNRELDCHTRGRLLPRVITECHCWVDVGVVAASEITLGNPAAIDSGQPTTALIPGLNAVLARAVTLGMAGTKIHSVIRQAS